MPKTIANQRRQGGEGSPKSNRRNPNTWAWHPAETALPRPVPLAAVKDVPGGPFGGTLGLPGVPNEGYTRASLLVPQPNRPSPGYQRQPGEQVDAKPVGPVPTLPQTGRPSEFPHVRSEDLPITPQGWREPHEAARRDIVCYHSRLITAGTSAGFQLPSVAEATQWLA